MLRRLGPRILIMPVPEQLTQYLNSPELALQNLDALFAVVASEDEASIELATEALENCGVPPATCSTTLHKTLLHGNSQAVYWAATLVGRLTGQAQPFETDLCTAFGRADLEEFARERIAWAFQQIGSLSGPTRSLLEKQRDRGGPRLKRLIAAALDSTQ